jgi:acyl-CoA oxidase
LLVRWPRSGPSGIWTFLIVVILLRFAAVLLSPNWVRFISADILALILSVILGHGSNARGIETEAYYDVDTKEFVINSPTPTSQKFWIGNAAVHGNWATVFANLRLPDGTNEGFHAFLVPIRDREGNLLAGVGAADCGYKMGM